MERVWCSFCNGTGTFTEDSTNNEFCLRCMGEGVVNREVLEYYWSGQLLQRERLQRGESIVAAAQRLGMSSRALNLRENGWRIDPKILARRLEARKRDNREKCA